MITIHCIDLTFQNSLIPQPYARVADVLALLQSHMPDMPFDGEAEIGFSDTEIAINTIVRQRIGAIQNDLKNYIIDESRAISQPDTKRRPKITEKAEQLVRIDSNFL